MAVSIQDSAHTGISTTSNTTVAASGVIAQPGWTLFACITFDNLTVTTPTVSSLTKGTSETASWAKIGSVDADSATGAAAVRTELWAIVTTIEWASTTVTATLSASVTAKAIAVRAFFGVTATARGTTPTGTTTAAGVSTGGTPTATSAGTAPVVGDLILGLAGFENNAVPALDSDSLGGAWIIAGNVATTGGGAAANVATSLQYKITTSTSAQTFNPVGTSDSGVGVLALVPKTLSTPSAPGSVTATTGSEIVTVGWAYSLDAETYAVSRDGSVVASGLTTKTYVDSPGDYVSHSYTVTATNAAGTSSASSSASAAATPTAKAETQTNDFSATNSWTLGASSSVVSGQLKTQCQTGTSTCNPPAATITLKDSYILAQVTPAPSPDGTNLRHTNLVWNTASLVVQAEYHWDTSLLAAQFAVYKAAAQLYTANYDATAMAWWSIREQGGSIYVDTSPDGSTWTNRASFVHGLTAAQLVNPSGVQQVQLASDSSDASPSGVFAFFDNYNLPVTSPNATGATPVRRIGKRR